MKKRSGDVEVDGGSETQFEAGTGLEVRDSERDSRLKALLGMVSHHAARSSTDLLTLTIKTLFILELLHRCHLVTITYLVEHFALPIILIISPTASWITKTGELILVLCHAQVNL